MSRKYNREKNENTADRNVDLKSQPKVNHKNLYLSDEQLQVLPDNDEEEKEILLTGKTIQAASSRRKDNLSKITKNRNYKNPNLGIRELVRNQTVQINKLTLIVQSVHQDIASTKVASKSIKEINTEIKKIRNQISQIQTQLTKKTQQHRTILKKRK